MTQTQVLSAVRNVLSLLVGWAVGKGWLDSDTAGVLVAVPLALVPLIWDWWSNRKPALIGTVAKMPEVEKIVTVAEKTAQAQPSTKVVSLGQTLRELSSRMVPR